MERPGPKSRCSHLESTGRGHSPHMDEVGGHRAEDGGWSAAVLNRPAPRDKRQLVVGCVSTLCLSPVMCRVFPSDVLSARRWFDLRPPRQPSLLQ